MRSAESPLRKCWGRQPSSARIFSSAHVLRQHYYGYGSLLGGYIFSRLAVKERFVASYEPFKKTKFILAKLYTRLSAINGGDKGRPRWPFAS